MRKKYFLVFIVLLVIPFMNVFAAPMASDSAQCNDNYNSTGNCSYYRNCSLYTVQSGNKYCALNRDDANELENLKVQSDCASNAGSESECKLCSGYVWVNSSCVSNYECANSANNEAQCAKCSGYVWENSSCILNSVSNIKSGVKISKVSCGNITGIPKKIPRITSGIIMFLQIAVPVILVIAGTIDFLKGVTADKEDEIKKGQQLFVKRLIAAAIIFFIVVIVKFLVSVIASSNSENIVSCIDCFISNDCK